METPMFDTAISVARGSRKFSYHLTLGLNGDPVSQAAKTIGRLGQGTRDSVDHRLVGGDWNMTFIFPFSSE